MKTLIVVRHAKSSWSDPGLEDHDRPLNKRGERDAPFMASVIAKRNVIPDLIVSSTAKRAFTTAKEFGKKLGYKKNKILRERELYLAEMEDLAHYVQQLDNNCETVFLFGHNPGFTWLVNHLANAAIDNMPTCGVCSIQFDTATWNDVGAGKGKLEFFEFPKKYFQDSSD